jgi:hypothetical protein
MDFSIKLCKSGVNPTIFSYYPRAVKIYNATSSFVRFEKKFLCFEKTMEL